MTHADTVYFTRNWHHRSVDSVVDQTSTLVEGIVVVVMLISVVVVVVRIESDFGH